MFKIAKLFFHSIAFLCDRLRPSLFVYIIIRINNLLNVLKYSFEDQFSMMKIER